MLLLLLSWIIISLSAFRISRWLGLYNPVSYFLSFLSGLAILLMVATGWALVLPAQWLLPGLLGLAIWEAPEQWGQLKMKSRGRLEWVLLLLICVLPSLLPNWINDESAYYLPSIKWYAEEGFVSGLGQWNIRYALSSSWHVLSAIFYWDFFPDRIWNFNGLLLFLFCLDYLRRQEKLLPLVPLILLSAPFINAPSPDLPILLCTAYLMLYHAQLSAREWSLVLLFILGIKATGLSLLLIGVYPLLRFRLQFLRYAWILLPFGLLWMLKNQVLTGHLLFPMNSAWLSSDHMLPINMLTEFRNGVLAEVYGLGFGGKDWIQADLSFSERILGLFKLKPYKVVMNLLILGSGFMMILFYASYKVRRIPIMSLWVGVSIALWVMMAPNYRFGLGIGVGALLILLQGQALIQFGSVLHRIGLAVLLIAVVWLNTIGTKNVRVVSCGEQREFGLSQLFWPVPYPEVVSEKVEAQVPYYRPGDCLYCGDAPRPCLPDTVKRTHERMGVRPWTMDHRP